MARKPNSTSSITATIHDQQLIRGAGGELHQIATGDEPVLTTAQGAPVADDQNSLRIGPRGPLVVDDFHFREKIFHFDHERIPERVVHARGYGAHGYFETYDSLATHTKADLFQRAGERTPAFVRFSTVAGNKGSADLARDVRGFAVKLYTKEGNWDLVGNNIPVFFIQDAIKFPDLVHAAKQEPDRAFPQAQTAHDTFWDFISLTPESMNMVMWIMSDRTIPRSFRFMEGFGVHTFRFINAKEQSTFVKFHWKPKLGLQSVAWNEAVKINGADPDFHRRDLWTAIQSGNFPEWELQVQLFDQDFADSFDFDVLDPTKIIPEEILAPKPVGRLVLDRMPDNFFAETEQVAFMTQNVPPGIDFSNDPLLQGRNFSYLDTQLKRLGGPNFTHLPINAPKCPFAHFQQDGHMAMRNPTGRANYQPNSFGEGQRESPTRGFQHFAAEEQGVKARLRPESFADHYSQARQFYISQTPPEQRHIASALTFELSKVETVEIRERMVSHLLNIDETLATTVAQKLGLQTMPEPANTAIPTRQDLEPSPALSIVERGPKRFEGRKLGILITDGVDAKLLKGLTQAVTAEKAVFEFIAPKVGGVTASNGTLIEAHHMIDGGPSVLFDAVALLTSEAAIAELTEEATARDFVADAFQHCKFIGYDRSALPLLEIAGIADAMDEGVLPLPGEEGLAAFVAELGKLRVWAREPSLKLGKASVPVNKE
ncbi:catalase [Agrobacterium tumefaciens]|uniref:Catalase n=1 Tax=Agrobacterium fabrum (strain C58 / ATCC 33970) TaxID=176299 RepID=Q7D2Y4_AGRFC|nr:catalase C [Agrobacterium fabrum]KEY51877.1 catalase [Agrobacterium tumefaciens]AAK90866.2 catalase C [Agrobacterium fabrum str. C58]KJX89907.1 catalase [Agrobacterium tumefaciens]MCX2875178.1 catalase C [Agrobacterium fabrum]NMV70916.1 catalase [Agrobacterium fabrum]